MFESAVHFLKEFGTCIYIYLKLLLKNCFCRAVLFYSMLRRSLALVVVFFFAILQDDNINIMKTNKW